MSFKKKIKKIHNSIAQQSLKFITFLDYLFFSQKFLNQQRIFVKLDQKSYPLFARIFFSYLVWKIVKLNYKPPTWWN